MDIPIIYKFVRINGIVSSTYMISNIGDMINVKTNTVLEGGLCDKGYRRITLSDNGKKYRCKIHRLVIQTFKPDEDELETYVCHIDGNKLNNRIDNLRYSTDNIRNQRNREKREDEALLLKHRRIMSEDTDEE